VNGRIASAFLGVALCSLLVVHTAQASQVVGGTPLTVTAATLNSITVSAPVASMPAGLTQAYTATGAYSDGTSRDLTDLATWTSSAPAIATVTPDGLATGVLSNAAAVQIIASYDGRSGAKNLTVNAATLSSITVSAPVSSIPRGVALACTATGRYSNGSAFDVTALVAWSSSAPSIATVSADGVALGVAASGVPVQIVASLGGRAGSMNLTVNAATLSQITVTGAASSIPREISQAYTATGIYSDGTSFDLTDLVTWASSAPSIATVTEEGVATGVQSSATPVQIVASYDGRAGGANLTVNDAALTQITVTAPAPTLPRGAVQPYTAIGTYSNGTSFDVSELVTWSSSAPSVAAISAEGVATAVQSQAIPITIAASLEVNQRPSAVLQATPTTGRAPLTVNFNGDHSIDPDAGDSIVRYTFTFGDGSPPIAQATPTISHVYSAAGTYAATLVVRDSQGNDSAAESLQIVVGPNRNPSAVLQASPTTGVAPMTVSFSGANSVDPDAGDSIVRYTFTFGDGSPPIAQATPTISHVYSAAGTYAATLVVRDSQGNDSAAESLQIVVSPNRNPSAVLQAGPTTGNAPMTVSFNGDHSIDPDAGDSIVRYTFTFGDGSPPIAQAGPTILHVYSAPGTYTATLVVRDSRGSNSPADSVQIVVNPNRKPSALLQATPTSGTLPLTVSFNGGQSADPDGDSIVRYTFTFGDGSPPIAQAGPAISRVYSAPGTYTATLVVRDSQGNDSSPTSVQIVVNNAIAITDVALVEGNSGTGKATFTVKLAVPSSQTVTVRYATRDGAALVGKDYVGATGTLTFPAGVTSQAVTIATVGELLFEGNEAFFVDLSAPVNAVITRATGRAIINNDDPSVGETAMTPRRLSVTAGEPITLSVSWTHPVSWRELQTLDVRLIDHSGHSALRVRMKHHQGPDSVTFRVFDEARGGFGPHVRPGRPEQFETSLATFHVAESTVVGLPGQTVTLNLRIVMKPGAAGRVYRVEAFATDDTGHAQGFDRVGTLTVRRR
jgi:PKD repeat protein